MSMAPWCENWRGEEILGEKRTRPSARVLKPNVQWTGRGPNSDFYRETPSANDMKSICDLMK